MASAAPAGTARCRDTTLIPNRANAARVRAATLCLLNQQRRSHGLARLRADRQLRSAAQRYSDQMVRRRFFDHISPDGGTLSTRVRRTAYLRSARTWWLGENIAWDKGVQTTPQRTVRKWMTSAEHRTQILNGRYRDIGIGVTAGTPRRNAGAGATYATVFGARRSGR